MLKKIVFGELCSSNCVKVAGMEEERKESLCSFGGRQGQKAGYKTIRTLVPIAA